MGWHFNHPDPKTLGAWHIRGEKGLRVRPKVSHALSSGARGVLLGPTDWSITQRCPSHLQAGCPLALLPWRPWASAGVCLCIIFGTSELAQGHVGQAAVCPGAEAIHSLETPLWLLLPWGWLAPPSQSGLQRET